MGQFLVLTKTRWMLNSVNGIEPHVGVPSSADCSAMTSRATLIVSLETESVVGRTARHRNLSVSLLLTSALDLTKNPLLTIAQTEHYGDDADFDGEDQSSTTSLSSSVFDSWEFWGREYPNFYKVSSWYVITPGGRRVNSRIDRDREPIDGRQLKAVSKM